MSGAWKPRTTVCGATIIIAELAQLSDQNLGKFGIIKRPILKLMQRCDNVIDSIDPELTQKCLTVSQMEWLKWLIKGSELAQIDMFHKRVIRVKKGSQRDQIDLFMEMV